ncbi:helix-turn-helix domain-containing protein [Fodinibius salsisoli]|uniref:Helix-turn-helix transcriptional regulator n=1 Tax=Fodinibius salsisoli TaxID=2820877 RepID=A0ABT3PQP7_9BACT|nr:AraC family transcriptional regulator [Fodinibius salsisoli]MCW9708192.1 helix-turn-helix transcriptional regulator [Fodinibius salsisoli]
MSEFNNVEKILAIYFDKLPEPNSNWPQKVQRVVNCIHSHQFDAGMTVRKLKQKCIINEGNFSAIFKYYVGLSPKQYIIKHRIAAACRLLKRVPTEYPILHVALAVGFSSHSAFSRTFKRRKGVTPSEFRRQS